MKTFLVLGSIIVGVLGVNSAQAESLSESFSITIDPKQRALDYQQVFEALRKEKPVSKVYVKLMDGSMIANIIDLQLMAHNTIFLIKYNTPEGIKLQVIELEHINTISYLE